MAAAVAQHVLLRPVAGRSNFRHRDALPAAPLAVHSLQLGLASSREAKSAGRQRAPLRCQALSSAGSAGAAPQQQQHANARRVVLAVDPTEVGSGGWVWRRRQHRGASTARAKRMPAPACRTRWPPSTGC